MSETFEYKGYNITIGQDTDAFDPRQEYDHLGEMVCFHRRYNLGDKHNYTVDEVHEMLNSGKFIALPLYLYDHSGITMSTGPFSCPWDSGQVGYIMVSKDSVRKEWGWARITRQRQTKIENILRGEVKEYDSFLTGDVWGFTIDDQDGEYVDSCWGFYGYEYCEKEAKDIVKHMSK